MEWRRKRHGDSDVDLEAAPDKDARDKEDSQADDEAPEDDAGQASTPSPPGDTTELYARLGYDMPERSRPPSDPPTDERIRVEKSGGEGEER